MKTRLFLPTLLFCISLSLLTPDLNAQKRRVPIKPITATVTVSASKPTPSERRHDAFMIAWSTLNQSYFDKTFGGLDWDKVRNEFEPLVAAAKTDAEFHRLLKQMIDRLGKSHLEVIIPEYFASLETAKKESRIREKQIAAAKATADKKPIDQKADDEADDSDDEDPTDKRYGIGVDLKMLGDQIIVAHVDKQSSAETAGLKPGFVIDKINGVSLKSVISRATLEGTSASDIKYLFPIEIVESFLNGRPDTSVYLTCLDEADAPKDFTIPRIPLVGETISIAKNLPDQFLRYEASSLTPDIGYIKFNAFAIPVVGKFCDSLTAFHDKKALILDLRGNLGGIIGSMIGLSGMVTDKSITLGNFILRNGSQPFTAASKKKHFSGKIVILVDGQSMSAAEMFTAGLQGNHRALVVGERTGGKSLPAVWIKLPTGAVMVYPIADFISPKGVSLEGKGLEPDQVVPLDRKSLLKGVDTQLQKAVDLIADDSAFVVKTKPPESTAKSSAENPSPPPPKAMVKPVPRIVAAPASTPGPDNPKGVKVIADFADAVGGGDALKNISSYEAKGNMTAGRNGETETQIYTARLVPDKYLVVLTSPSVGEVREVYNGKSSFLQTDYGIDQSMPAEVDKHENHLLVPFLNVLEPGYLKGIKYEGQYEAEGQMRQILSATDAKGRYIGLSFDTATKMLVTYTAEGVLYNLGDYRKTNGMTLPFHVEIDGVMNVHLDSITINRKLDTSLFEKKEKCFDKAN